MAVEYLYKFFEADDVSGASETPLVPGSETVDYVIPDGELWGITHFGGSASSTQTEIELLYSDDGGVTWTNPFDNTINKLICLHLESGNPVEKIFSQGFEFTGSGTDVIIRIKVKNYNTSSVSEISAWIEGTTR